MNWIDTASIVFVCVTMNHLGLIKAIEEVIGRELPIINCPKCCTMWCVLAFYLMSVGFSDMPLVLAVSFISSYLAIWLELLEGYVDSLYLRLYDKIYETSYDTSAADTDGGHPEDSVPEL